jgi:hypothetical protein
MNVERILTLLFYLVIVIIVCFALIKVVDILADDNTLNAILLPGVLR